MRAARRFQVRLFVHYILLMMLLIGVFGCGEEKESLHELDHVVPTHWPEGLQDAADKIDERLTTLRNHSATSEEELAAARQELADLVSWAPEIAADTDLTEQDWIPIYQLSENIREHFLAGDVKLEKFEAQLVELQSLLQEADAKLSEATSGG